MSTYHIEVADPLDATVPKVLEGPFSKIGDARRAIRAWPPHRVMQPTRRVRYMPVSGKVRWRECRSRRPVSQEP